MKKIILLFTLTLISFSCKTHEKKNPAKEYNLYFSSYKLDSLLNDKTEFKFPLTIAIFKDDIELKISSYGEKGDFGSTYSDGELASQVFFLKVLNLGKVVDSIEVHKKEIGEGVFKSKVFSIKKDNIIEIKISEEWEDEETGNIEKLDSLYIYQIINQKITLKNKGLLNK